MSIPERIWRIVRGRWLVAEERSREASAHQDAHRELSQAIRGTAASYPAVPYTIAPSARRPGSPQSRPPHDPLAADLALLGAPPACDMPTLDRLYADRLAELKPEAHPPGSPERDHLVNQRLALAAAYERLRDTINTTETRFEKLEF
jgi:hypothetical protein